MARNEEKAQSMLNRWLAYKRDQAGTKVPRARRPKDVNTVNTVTECERWRMQLIREIGKKVMGIQNESLGEQRIRDLNDEINKLLREKAHWERRILELGGPNYRKQERIADQEFFAGISDVEGQGGSAYYYYFGAARNLPGVKEHLQKKAPPKKKKVDYKGIDAEYYGYNDDEDGLLEKLEAEAEKQEIARAVEEWKEKGGLQSDKLESAQLTAVIPTKEQITKMLVEKKKDDLLKKYVSPELEANLEQSKKEVEVVLGKRKETG